MGVSRRSAPSGFSVWAKVRIVAAEALPPEVYVGEAGDMGAPTVSIEKVGTCSKDHFAKMGLTEAVGPNTRA